MKELLREMLIEMFIQQGVLHTREIIEAFEKVPREEFVLPRYRDYAYVDEPLPTMEGQTISQPFTVAIMTEALQPGKGMKILEVGAGSGYQAAILSRIVGHYGKIYSIERIHALAEYAHGNLVRAGITNVTIVRGDGTLGYSKFAPYDRIIVTASSPGIPESLIEQLADHGRMVIPVGNDMTLLIKNGDIIKKENLGKYNFVPLIGQYGHKAVS